MIAVADADEESLDPRLQGVGRSSEGKVVLLPEKGITVQVKDPSARVVSGSTVTWQTARQAGVTATTVPGVIVTYSLEDFVDTTSGNECPTAGTTCYWSNLLDEVKVKGLTRGSDPPGGVKVIVNSDPIDQSSIHFDANSGNSYTSTRSTWPLGQYVSDHRTAYYLEFSTLGTHVIDFRAGVTRRSDFAVQEDTGTYTFHVGPIAELEVRDGGAGIPPSGSRAFNVVAVNNGPDIAPAAKVTLTGLSRSPKPDYTATRGTLDFDDEADGGNGAWVWDIGEMADTEITQIVTCREGEILNLATDDSKEITASIENTEDYEVCIDSSGDDVDLSSPSETACTNASSTTPGTRRTTTTMTTATAET